MRFEPAKRKTVSQTQDDQMQDYQTRDYQTQDRSSERNATLLKFVKVLLSFYF